EMGRVTLKDLVVANLLRVQEASRVLEEFAKFTNTDAAKKFKNFRFKVYKLEKEIITSREKKSLLDFHLYVILGDDGTLGDKNIIAVAAEAIEGGAGAIQMRIKNGGTRDLLQIGHKLRELTTSKGVTFIVNDRPDIALAVNADGVHLGQDDLPAGVARNIIGTGKIIGISTHSREQALEAIKDGADYIGVGPVFGTRTKAGAGSPVGTELLRVVSSEIHIPIVAIGGINADNVVNVLEAGVTKCAVISAVAAAQDVVSATKRIKSAILSGRSK
ncbi:MAG TPA: thiamine phosphate synthase, partial [Clostridia bacterium]|nr:thiamine phosphate synthase [Clostridia bacterium]